MNENIVIVSDRQEYFQQRLFCTHSSKECKDDPTSCSSTTDGVCATSIDDLSAVPGSEFCCCNSSQLEMAKLVKGGSAVHCHHTRQCQFTCCPVDLEICGDSCCRHQELCGAKPINGSPCCVAPSPSIVASPDAPQFPEMFKLHSYHECCPFGVGEICSTRQPCCLDIDGITCESRDQCISKSGMFTKLLIFSSLMAMLVGIAGIILMFKLSSRIAFYWRRAWGFGAQPEERNQTSGGVYGQTSELLENQQQQ